jgi:hypothetical protein
METKRKIGFDVIKFSRDQKEKLSTELSKMTMGQFFFLLQKSPLGKQNNAKELKGDLR